MATAGDSSDRDADDREMIESLRANQGFHECEVFGSGAEEVESERAWTTCHKTKNQHANFISVSNFSEQNLPDSCSNKKCLVEFIKAFSNLTVKLRVEHVSATRPDDVVFSEAYGENVSHLGTGWVYKVKRQTDRTENVPSYVTDTSKGITVWWEVEIFTACHVVYDKQEALRTRVDLFYDDESSQVRSLYCYDVRDNDPRNDVCVLLCFTSDDHLGETLDDLYKHYQKFSKEVYVCEDPFLCVIISHPHGGPKRITVGELKGDAKYGLRQSLLTEYMKTYTTETCKGSSGAPVLIFPGWTAEDSEAVWPGAGPHSWGLHEKLNQCAAGAFYVNGTRQIEIIEGFKQIQGMFLEIGYSIRPRQAEYRERVNRIRQRQAEYREMDDWIRPRQAEDGEGCIIS